MAVFWDDDKADSVATADSAAISVALTTTRLEFNTDCSAVFTVVAVSTPPAAPSVPVGVAPVLTTMADARSVFASVSGITLLLAAILESAANTSATSSLGVLPVIVSVELPIGVGIVVRTFVPEGRPIRSATATLACVIAAADVPFGNEETVGIDDEPEL